MSVLKTYIHTLKYYICAPTVCKIPSAKVKIICTAYIHTHIYIYVCLTVSTRDSYNKFATTFTFRWLLSCDTNIYTNFISIHTNTCIVCVHRQIQIGKTSTLLIISCAFLRCCASLTFVENVKFFFANLFALHVSLYGSLLLSFVSRCLQFRS